MKQCLDEDTVLGFVAGSLDADGRSRVETHMASCPACDDVVTWAAADLAGGDRPAGREGAPFIARLLPGAMVDRYQILGPIGRGAMGEVYAAYHPDLDRRIALKVVLDPVGLPTTAEFPQDVRASRERRARLLREARAIARLSHPNVVAVHDAGTVGEHVYVAMEFVDGQTLDAWLQSEPRRWRAIVDVFLMAGRGLAAAHAAGVVHRDFKPQNVMIGKDGSVRVMDFGLARLVSVGPETSDEPGDSSPGQARGEAVPTEMPAPGRTTRTGAFLGTPAYMAPEQFRGERADARSDQFSFCVALHEALYGKRPSAGRRVAQQESASPFPLVASRGSGMSASPATQADIQPSRSNVAAVPSWLRRILRRGVSVERDARFSSLDHLLAALERGRTRLRRRMMLLGIAVGVAVISLSAWRVGHRSPFDCRPPVDRVAAAWPLDAPTNSRRQSMHRTFTASGRPDAERSWQGFVAALDEYVRRWTTTYSETCEATHVRGEQSAELLDLRMRCLYDRLDDVRALTDVVATDTDDRSAAKSLAAAGQLTPLSRCADDAVLRSIVPLPRDERTLAAVRQLKQSIKEIRVRFQSGLAQESLSSAYGIRPAVEATTYKPLLAELLDLIGDMESNFGDPQKAEAIYLDALAVAEASGDDEAAAMAACGLSFSVGYAQGRHRDGRTWVRIGSAILDRLGPGHSEVRSWFKQNESAMYLQARELARARVLQEEAVRLKVDALGPEHPDLAGSLSSLGLLLNELGLAEQALTLHDRAVALLTKHGHPSAMVLNNRAETLRALKRDGEAEADWRRSLDEPQNDRERASALTGLGQIAVETGHVDSATQLLTRALDLRAAKEPDPILNAETSFALAEALWKAGRDRPRALLLAREARKACGDERCPSRLARVGSWLESHERPHLSGPGRAYSYGR